MTLHAKLAATLLLTALLWQAAVPGSLAGPLDSGDASYKAGQYAQAVTAYQQAAGQTQGVEQAKADYKLGNAYHRLGDDSQARQAYQQAQKVDPSLSFASSPDKFRQAVARATHSNAPASRSTPAGTAPLVNSERDPVFQTLSAGNVYIDPRLTDVSQPKLEQAAKQSNDNPHTLVKIAVLRSVPPGYPSLDAYAGRLHQALNLGKNGLVVVVDSPRGVGADVVTTGLSRAENQRLAQAAVSQISVDATAGTAGLAAAVASAINNREYRGSVVIWVIFLIIVLAIAALLISGWRRKKQQLAAARQPIEALHANVLSGIEYLDNYTDVLPANNPDSDQVRALRQSASAKYEQAVRILTNATEMSDLQRAQGLLDRAQTDVQQARRALDRATGGTGSIPGDDAFRPPPLPESQQEVEAVPADKRGVSFFSSQPAPLSSLVPVTVTVNGESRQVLVTPQEADELRQGRMPQVRAFQVGGRYVPWYEYPDYNPYNDYWRYQNAGWGGFGDGIFAGMIGAELLGGLTAPHYYGGGMPYAFATDNDYYRGYNDAAQGDRAAGYSFGNTDSQMPADNAGGAGFFSGGGPGYDTQGYDNAGGAGFMSGGNDFGGDQS